MTTEDLWKRREDVLKEFTEYPGQLEILTNREGKSYWRIRQPGKFEGNLLSAVYYYNLAMEGFSDGEIDLELPPDDEADEWDSLMADYFELDEDDWTLWPELHGDKYIGLYTDDYGFLRVLDSAEVERLLAEDAGEA